MAEKIKVGGELEAVTKDGKLADAAQVVDSTQSKTQELINSEVKEKLDAVIDTDGSVKIPTITLSGDVTGSGTTAISGTIASGAVTTDKIATDAVTTAKIASKAVTTGTIADDAVTADKIASNAVGYDQIAVNSITTSMIRDSQVTTAKIADSNVTTAKIANSAVTNAKLANSKVTIGNKSVSLGGTLTEIPEAYLSWGGRSYNSASISEAYLIPNLGANRIAGLNPAGITVEYSTDSGETWTNYGEYLNQKRMLTTVWGSLLFTIGKSSDINNLNKKMLRITIDASYDIYTRLNKFVLYLSTNGSTGCYCTLQKAIYPETSTPDVAQPFVNIQTDSIGGWPGTHTMNISEIIFGGGANVRDGRIKYLRFVFGCTNETSTNSGYIGLVIGNIFAYGGVGWACPSYLAKYGTPYKLNYDKSVSFEGGVSATSLSSSGAASVSGTLTASTIKKSGGTSAQFLKADGSVDGNTYLTTHQDISGKVNKSDVESTITSTSTNPVTSAAISTALTNKVDKVSGKGLSTNDYTTAEKNKLKGIADNANNYTLPTASGSVLGGIKVGTGLSIDDGTLSVDENRDVKILYHAAQAPASIATTYTGVYYVLADTNISGSTTGAIIAYYNNGTAVNEMTLSAGEVRLCADGTRWKATASGWTQVKSAVNVAQTTGTSTEDVMSQKAVTDALANKADKTALPSAATASTAGLAKLYTATGTNTDGAMTQKATTDAINTASSNAVQTADLLTAESTSATDAQVYSAKAINKILSDAETSITEAASAAHITLQGNIDLKLDKASVDTALSTTSTNPVQNKVIAEALDNKADKGSNVKLALTGTVDGYYAAASSIPSTVTAGTFACDQGSGTTKRCLTIVANGTIVNDVAAADGAMYMDKNNGHVYIAASGNKNAWVDAGQIKGDKGEKGADGKDGKDGVDGAQTVVQTTGTSTTDVMSQAAVTSALETADKAPEPFIWYPGKDLSHYDITAIDHTTGTFTLSTSDHDIAVGDTVVLAPKITSWTGPYALGTSWYTFLTSTTLRNVPGKQSGVIKSHTVTAVDGATIQCDSAIIDTTYTYTYTYWQLQKLATSNVYIELPDYYKGRSINIQIMGIRYALYSTWPFFDIQYMPINSKKGRIVPTMSDGNWGAPYLFQEASIATGRFTMVDYGVNLYGENIQLGSTTNRYTESTGTWDMSTSYYLWAWPAIMHYATQITVTPYHPLHNINVNVKMYS